MKQGSRLQVSDKVRVALTQSRGRLESLQVLLEQRGYEVIRQPLIETHPLLDYKTRLEAERLLECAWILFTSRTAVETWQQFGLGFSKRTLITANIGAVGKKTAAMLEQLGATVSLISSWQNADNLAELFVNHPEAKSPIGLPHGDKALDILQTKLQHYGFEVRPVVIYKTIQQPQRFHNVDVIVLASPSAVEALKDIDTAQLIVIGETTLEAVKARGWQATKTSSLETQSITEAIERIATEHFNKGLQPLVIPNASIF
jgi:uroporphyrinogen-III synthase